MEKKSNQLRMAVSGRSGFRAKQIPRLRNKEESGAETDAAAAE